MISHRKSLFVSRVFLDSVILTVSYIIAFLLSFPDTPFTKELNVILFGFALLFVWFFASRSFGVYDEFRSRSFLFEFFAIFRAELLLAIVSITLVFLAKNVLLSRFFIIIFFSAFTAGVLIAHTLTRLLLQNLRRNGMNVRNLLIVGAGDVGTRFYDSITENPHFGYRLIGFVDDDHKTFLNGQYLGTTLDLEQVIKEKSIDDVIIALPNYAHQRVEEVIRICEHHTIRVKIIPDYFRFAASKYNVSMFGSFPIISVREDKINEFHWRVIKRTFDIIFSLLVLIFVLSWLWPILCISIRFSSKGKCLFKQERWGRNNKKFIALKFRSLYEETQVTEDSDYKQVTENDERVTKIGRFLRKTNLDELPQFWNVLMGDMSVVGPRPHPTPLNLQSKDKVPLYMLRHLVKPGITGLAQVEGYRGETKDEKQMKMRITKDLWYIENWSFTLDIQLIFLTVWRMFKGDPNAY